MNTEFYNELRDSIKRAYEWNQPMNVPNFSHWWAHNEENIMTEMRNRADEGICAVMYPLPSDWAFYLVDCRSYFESKFSSNFKVYVNLITRGIYNEVTLEVRW